MAKEFSRPTLEDPGLYRLDEGAQRRDVQSITLASLPEPEGPPEQRMPILPTLPGARVTADFGIAMDSVRQQIEITLQEGDSAIVRVHLLEKPRQERRSSFLPQLAVTLPAAAGASPKADVPAGAVSTGQVTSSGSPRSVVTVQSPDRPSFELRPTHMPEIGGPLQDNGGMLQLAVHPLPPKTRDMLTKAFDVIERGIQFCKSSPLEHYPNWAGVFVKAVHKIREVLAEAGTPGSLVKLIENPALCEKILTFLTDHEADTMTWRKRIFLEQAQLAKRSLELEIELTAMEATLPLPKLKPHLKAAFEEALSSTEEGFEECQKTAMAAYPEWEETFIKNGGVMDRVLMDQSAALLRFMNEHPRNTGFIIEDFQNIADLNDKQRLLLEAAVLSGRHKTAVERLIMMSISSSATKSIRTPGA